MDVEKFELEAAKLNDRSDPADYATVLAFYPGDLLPKDLYEEWTIPQREALRRVYHNLLLNLARLYETQLDYPAQMRILQQIIAADPSNEEAHAGLVHLFALSGQRQKALRQYQLLREVLQTELGAEPSPGYHHPVRRYPGRAVSPAAEPDLPGRLPLFSEEKKSTNLPVQLTSFIGREKEIDEVSGLCQKQRLVTLNGSGGTGKTRLALQVAAEIQGNFPDGAWMVHLASLTDPYTIPQNIAAALGLQEGSIPDYRTLLIHFLREKKLLLVLDNCEHLLDTCARLVNDLLEACPKLTIITTSREALGIAGETAYRVPSLSLPDLNHLPPVEEFSQIEAVRLFTERASAVSSGFTLSSDDLPHVARVCCRLDGIPLALELAAARVGVFSIAQIAALLDDRFRLLTGGSRTALPRQRTLRASMDWSYSLLCDSERALLQHLSVFNGGCTLESIEAVCADRGLIQDDVVDLITSLVNKSLLVADHQPRSATRYRLIETIRQYAQEKLADGGSADAVRDRHLAYYLRLVEEMEPQLKTRQAPVLLDQLDAELENLRAALGWALSKGSPEGYSLELRLFCGLWRYWSSRGLFHEGIVWGKRGLESMAAFEAQENDLRGRACFHLGFLLSQYAFDSLEWKPYLEESTASYRKSANTSSLALALAYLRRTLISYQTKLPTQPAFENFDPQAMAEESLALVDRIPQPENPEDLWKKAWVYGWVGEYGCDGEWLPDSQISLIQQADAIFRALGDHIGEISATEALGDISLKKGDAAAARAYYQVAFGLARDLKSKPDLENSIGDLGLAAYQLQDYQEMENCFLQAQELASEITGGFHRIWPQRMQAKAVLHQGDIPRARAIFLENLHLAQKNGDTYGVLSNLLGLAGIAARSGDPERAARGLAFFDRQMENFFKPADFDDQDERIWHINAIREQLDALSYAACCEQGRKMTLEEAITEAIATQAGQSQID